MKAVNDGKKKFKNELNENPLFLLLLINVNNKIMTQKL